MKPRLIAASVLVIIVAMARAGQAEEASGEISLKLSPRQVDPAATSLRLMPSEADLVDGNAAVVMLRLIGGENNFMRDIAPKIKELIALPKDDPRRKNEVSFDRIYQELSRAALMRTADWGYPLQQGRELMLPDLQSHRYIAGFGLSLWIGNQLEAGQTSAAWGGIRTQLACARHVGRTPILVNQMVAVNMASMSIDRLESMVGEASVPNLYWPLAMLPDRIVDIDAALQWESETLDRSLASLGDSMPPIGDPVWDKIVNEFSDVMVSSGAFVNTEMEAMILRMKLLVEAKKRLPTMGLYSDDEISKMPDQELVMRWILHVARSVNYEIQGAGALEPAQAIVALAAIQERNEKLKNDLGAPGVPFIESPASVYLSVSKFDRFIKLLQTAEAIGHQTAINGGVAPDSLDQIKGLPVPSDPLTGKAFEYKREGDVILLRTPVIEGIDESLQRIVAKTYAIKIEP